MPLLHVLKKRLSGREDNWLEEQAVFVDQAQIGKALYELGAPEYHHIAALPLLERSDLLRDICMDQGDVAPFSPLDFDGGPGEDDLGRLVHPVRESTTQG